MTVLAAHVIGRMQGGAQSYLMCAVDGTLWVVKFQNNPQHIRVLANEFIVTRLAEIVGLPVPKPGIIEVVPWLAANERRLEIEFGGGRRERCPAGLHFGSRFVGQLAPGDTIDFLPPAELHRIINPGDFAGMLALDKWTANCDSRQAVFARPPHRKRYKAVFIDHGFCFNGGEWNFPDSTSRGVYPRKSMYAGVTGWSSFSPWLERIEDMDPKDIQAVAEAVPTEWYGGDRIALARLLGELTARRKLVRTLITDLRNSNPHLFPNWIN